MVGQWVYDGEALWEALRDVTGSASKAALLRSLGENPRIVTQVAQDAFKRTRLSPSKIAKWTSQVSRDGARIIGVTDDGGECMHVVVDAPLDLALSDLAERLRAPASAPPTPEESLQAALRAWERGELTLPEDSEPLRSLARAVLAEAPAPEPSAPPTARERRQRLRAPEPTPAPEPELAVGTRISVEQLDRLRGAPRAAVARGVEHWIGRGAPLYEIRRVAEALRVDLGKARSKIRAREALIEGLASCLPPEPEPTPAPEPEPEPGTRLAIEQLELLRGAPRAVVARGVEDLLWEGTPLREIRRVAEGLRVDLGRARSARQAIISGLSESRPHPAAEQIRRAYLARTGGLACQRVRLADLLTPALSPSQRRDALLEMIRGGWGHLMPLDDPHDRTARDDAAAIHIAGHPRHLIYLENR